jgi:competence protein ComEC
VNFLNVFEGDSALIVNRAGNFMIDAGRRNYVLKPLVGNLPFFEKTIDVVFISHADSDHFEGLNFILDEYNVRVAVLNDFDNSNDNYVKMLEKLLAKDVKLVLGTRGMELNTEGLKIKCLYPDRSDLGISKTNEKSEVLLINTLDKK